MASSNALGILVADVNLALLEKTNKPCDIQGEPSLLRINTNCNRKDDGSNRVCATVTNPATAHAHEERVEILLRNVYAPLLCQELNHTGSTHPLSWISSSGSTLVAATTILSINSPTNTVPLLETVPSKTSRPLSTTPSRPPSAAALTALADDFVAGDTEL